MTRGIYTAATGMLAEESAQQVVAQNLANASTTGYKQDIPVFKSFGETLVSMSSDTGVDAGSIGALGHGASLDQIYTDLSDGSLQQTGNPLDVALRGNAYLAVQSPAGKAYTRDGQLTVNADSKLVQVGTGLPILDDRGQTITMPDRGAVTIGPDGGISVDGNSVDQLGLYAIDGSNNPSKVGDNLLITSQTPKALDAGANSSAGYVQSGFLEASNVNIVKQMVTMIACQRSYEANAKALQSQDEMQDKAVNQVGMV